MIHILKSHARETAEAVPISDNRYSELLDPAAWLLGIRYRSDVSRPPEFISARLYLHWLGLEQLNYGFPCIISYPSDDKMSQLVLGKGLELSLNCVLGNFINYTLARVEVLKVNAPIVGAPIVSTCYFVQHDMSSGGC